MSTQLPTPEEMLAYRMKNFNVEVKKSPYPSYDGSKDISLSVTHNGFQWHSIGLLPCEARRVIIELENYLKALEVSL